MTPFRNREVQARFEAYPADVRRRMLALRELVLKTAVRTPGVGDIDETLKWGEPAYVTVNKAGSTVQPLRPLPRIRHPFPIAVQRRLAAHLGRAVDAQMHR